MQSRVIFSVLCLIFMKQYYASVISDSTFKEVKNSLIGMELEQAFGGKLYLTEKETVVNNMLMEWKDREVSYSFRNPQFFNFSKHYLQFKDEMEKSGVYRFIRSMPKGAVLHVHSMLMFDAEHLMELTYEEHLYVCLTDSYLRFHFSNTDPKIPCPVKWNLLSELRNASDNVEQLDAKLKMFLTLDSEDHIGFDANINTVWNKFNQVLRTTSSLISYRPVREKAFHKALQNFYDDKVMYIEIRDGLGSLYELNGTTHDKLYTAMLYDKVTKDFMESNPDFIGVKLIINWRRMSISEGLDLARLVKESLPNMFAGFDLVGQEDLGTPLSEFVSILLEAKDEIDYYFHGGETNWYGAPSDENLFDAVLLGTKRLGHAYALIKHPSLIEIVKDNDIALEVNVISNSVLCLVQDLRNHPLASYLALDLPVVLSSDDPGVWGAKPLTDDFYISFMGIASKHSDLKMLKQLALNSIKYSALDDKGKEKFFNEFGKKWNEFIDDIIRTYGL